MSRGDESGHKVNAWSLKVGYEEGPCTQVSLGLCFEEGAGSLAGPLPGKSANSLKFCSRPCGILAYNRGGWWSWLSAQSHAFHMQLNYPLRWQFLRMLQIPRSSKVFVRTPLNRNSMQRVHCLHAFQPSITHSYQSLLNSQCPKNDFRVHNTKHHGSLILGR